MMGHFKRAQVSRLAMRRRKGTYEEKIPILASSMTVLDATVFRNLQVLRLVS